MSVEETEELELQLSTYLKFNDVIDKDLISAIIDLTMGTQNSNLSNITVPVRSSLTQIATFTESVLARDLYLSDGVTYKKIIAFHHDWRRQKSDDLN